MSFYIQRVEGFDGGAAEQQTSKEWLRTHNIENVKLTLKDLVNKGKICRLVSFCFLWSRIFN